MAEAASWRSRFRNRPVQLTRYAGYRYRGGEPVKGQYLKLFRQLHAPIRQDPAALNKFRRSLYSRAEEQLTSRKSVRNHAAMHVAAASVPR